MGKFLLIVSAPVLGAVVYGATPRGDARTKDISTATASVQASTTVLLITTSACALGVLCEAAVAAQDTGRVLDANGLRLTLGEQVTILKDGALGLRYFPDEGTSSIGGPGHTKLVLAATNDSYVVEGPDLLHLNSAKRVLSPGPPGSFDNGYTGMSAVYADKNGRLYAVYHAEDHEGIPILGKDQPPGYYASVAIAESNDAGGIWTKLGQVVTSGKPKNFKAFPDHNARGAGGRS